MVTLQHLMGAGYGQWEARQKGERPIVKNDPVSCLTPKYQFTDNESVSGEVSLRGIKSTSVEITDSGFMSKSAIYENKSIFRLPGRGDQTNDKCGQWTHPLSCPNHGQMTLEGRHHDRYVAQHSCHNPDCPICYESWASRQAENTADRLRQAVELYRKDDYKIRTSTGFYLIGRIDHIVFSPPQELARELIRTSQGAKKLRSMAIKIIKKAGVVAGSIIFHPFRQNDSRELNFNPGMPKGVWYESPHFHVVGCGYLQKSDEFYAKTGWTYKKMERRETVKGTVKYTLTHCGIADGFQAVTYFGLFSNNKVVIDEIKRVTEPIKCQACGEALHLYSMKETDEGLEVDWSDDLGVYLHVVVKKTYKLRDKFKFVYNPAMCGYDKVKN